MVVLIVLIVSVLIASGISSMVEAAILSLPLIKARVLYEAKRKGSRDLLIIKQDIYKAVATIVVINNAINIVGSIFVGRMVTSMFGSQWLGVTSAIFTFFIIVVSEVIPKTIGEHYKAPISLAIAKPLRGIIFVFKPFVSVIIFVTASFRKKVTLPKVTEEEIKAMLKIGEKEGTVEVDEQLLCNRVFKLNDLKASQMMKPLKETYSIESDKKLFDAKDAIIDSPYSRIVLYQKDPSNIVGVCRQRVLLRELSKDNYEALVKDFMSAPIFVNETERADRLLEKFQASHQHLFVVKDKSGKNIGIISMEDVLEELFGEIYDEKDSTVKK